MLFEGLSDRIMGSDRREMIESDSYPNRILADERGADGCHCQAAMSRGGGRVGAKDGRS